MRALYFQIIGLNTKLSLWESRQREALKFQEPGLPSGLVAMKDWSLTSSACPDPGSSKWHQVTTLGNTVVWPRGLANAKPGEERGQTRDILFQKYFQNISSSSFSPKLVSGGDAVLRWAPKIVCGDYCVYEVTLSMRWLCPRGLCPWGNHVQEVNCACEVIAMRNDNSVHEQWWPCLPGDSGAFLGRSVAGWGGFGDAFVTCWPLGLPHGLRRILRGNPQKCFENFLGRSKRREIWSASSG